MLIPLASRGLIALGALAHVHVPPKALFAASDAIFTFATFITALVTLKTLRLSPPQILAALLALGVIVDTNYFATETLNLLHVYDLPAVFFAFLATNLLLRRKLGWFYVLLPIALLNRETAVFLCLMFLLTQWGRMPLPVLVGHMAAQGVMVLAIKAAVLAAFRHNPGAGALSFYTTDFDPAGAAAHRLHDLRVLENLKVFITLRRLLHMSSIFGFLWVPYLFALKRLQDPFFKATAWVFPPFFALMLVVGNIDEFRIYSELIPPLFFTVTLGCARWMGSGVCPGS
jgi:predicted membrane-bound dolichyl-phosphate-mannose-protein mannosyltransferase